VSRRWTATALAALGLAAWFLWLGVAAGRAELFAAALPLVLALAAAARPGAPARYRLVHELDAGPVHEGERVRATLTLTALSPLPQVELFEPLPAGLRAAGGGHHVVLALAAGETLRWSYTLACPARLRATLGTVHLRLWSRSGFAHLEAVERDPKPLAVYPRAEPLRRLPAPLRTQTSVGNYVAAVVGEGLEPGEIRPFAPGDRARHVNWRASLRLGRLYVTRHQEERNADVVLMLDSLGQAGAGVDTTLHAACRTAASLAAAYLRRKDRVGLVEYGGVFRWLRPGAGRAQLDRLLDLLSRAEVTFTYVRRDLALVPPRILPPQALVLAVSPLLDPRFVVALRDLAARGFDLVVLVVDPVAPTLAALPRRRRRLAAAGRLWGIDRRVWLNELRGQGLRVVECPAGEPLELVLSRLERAAARRSAG
jgi:uncharacterized protein (DUF58 family)